MNRRPNLKKRQSIMDAALDAFQEQGFQGANMDDIAERAHVSKRTVYNHFPSKQALFEHIAEAVWEQANEATNLEFNPREDIRSQLLDLALSELALVSDAHFLKQTRMLIAELMHNQAMAETTLGKFAEQDSNIGLWMKHAADSGALDITDPESAGKKFHSLIKCQAFWPQLIMGESTLPASQHQSIAQEVVTMFLAVHGTS